MTGKKLATWRKDKVARFNRTFEELFKEFPEAKKEAIRAIGTSTKKTLGSYINQSDLHPSAKKNVWNWQGTRYGSRGGYVAVSPISMTTQSVHRTKKGEKTRQNTYNGKPVTTRQITRWLERGYPVREPAPGSSRQWSRAGRSGVNAANDRDFVKGRMFYSWTKTKAFDIALENAYIAMDIFTDKLTDL